MIEGQKMLIDACVEEKVPRYIASDYTLDYDQLEFGDLPSKDPMKHLVKYLEDKPIKGVHIMIGAFIEVFWHYLGMWDAKNYELKYWGTGDEKWEFSTYGNTAQWIAAVALDPKANGVLKCKFSSSCTCSIELRHLNLHYLLSSPRRFHLFQGARQGPGATLRRGSQNVIPRLDGRAAEEGR